MPRAPRRGKPRAAPKEPDFVWARTSPGRTKRMLRSEAASEGLDIATSRGYSFGGARTHGVRGDRMSKKEQRECLEKTGVLCETRGDLRKAMKSKGLREAEKGEKCHEMFDALADHAMTGAPLDDQYKLQHLDIFGAEAKRPKFDQQAVYLSHCQRLGVKPNL